MCGVATVIVGLACLGYAEIWAAVTVVPAFEAERDARVAFEGSLARVRSPRPLNVDVNQQDIGFCLQHSGC